MFDRTELLDDKILCGLSMEMSLIENKTKELWSAFMPQKKSILNSTSSDLFSLQCYHRLFDYKNFNPSQPFIKWAAIEVKNRINLPSQLQTFDLAGGLYAVFIHHGTPQEFHKTLAFIFQEWLPDSLYEVDERPHFELLKENYRPDDPQAKEEVWIPIIKKQK